MENSEIREKEHEKLQAIRKQLRLCMNGVIATSLREKGMNYKLIFGVPLPEIRQIARMYQPDVDLAEALWHKNVREMKILATMLYPSDVFLKETALRWIDEVPYQEIAEQLSAHLLSASPDREAIVSICLGDGGGGAYRRSCGFLCVANLCIREEKLSPETETLFLSEAKKELAAGVSLTQQAASLALKRFGRLSAGQAAEVLQLIGEFQHCGKPEQEEFYKDIRFEFEYYT